MSEVVWWTGFAVLTGLAACCLWLLLTFAAEAFDATWFTGRCLLEGATKNPSVGNVLRIWSAAFSRKLHSARASGGYRIVYPGYGDPADADD